MLQVLGAGLVTFAFMSHFKKNIYILLNTFYLRDICTNEKNFNKISKCAKYEKKNQTDSVEC